MEIINQNPQLKNVAELPANIAYQGGDQCRHFNERESHPKHFKSPSRRQYNQAVLKGVTSQHTCLDATADSGAKAYEKEYGTKRTFTLVLHPETPRVWRIYEETFKPESEKGRPMIYVDLLVEFDKSGKRVVTAAPVIESTSIPTPPTGNQPTNGKDLGDSGTVVEKTTNDTSVRVQEDCDKYSSPIQILRKIACIMANKQPEMSGK